MEAVRFEALGVSEDILSSLHRMEYVEPTQVQALTIGPFLEGKDLLVKAPTGTGKTAAFGMPVIQKLDPSLSAIQALILCPTRELAQQIAAVLRELARSRPGIRIATVYGGENIEKQFASLRKKPQIVVATPGRLLDHMSRRTVRFDHVNTVVLDEADRMLDMGFRNDLRKILTATPIERQTVLFSATLPQEIILLAGDYQKNAEEITVEQQSSVVETVRQYYIAVETGGKDRALLGLMKENQLTLVFVNMKHRADKIAMQLSRRGIRAAALHGDMKQSQRNRVMQQYRDGSLDVLVATDVAARGIDVKNIDVVINYDIPLDNDSYVHRIGRTGRAQQEGLAYTILFYDEADRMRDIIKKLRVEILPVEGTLPIPEKAAVAPRGQSFHSINKRKRRPFGIRR
ncbi:DEAD/DEAH box helicase [Eubacteriales bacterium OttesenSCG-928-K08]|nr:DEAD/DEAH box helicase [Eubacteriales bacterium OttesenSCG-928-K08]